jgi:antibiotic biosynthesis monooxygenase (ABM) superfamily enzyme
LEVWVTPPGEPGYRVPDPSKVMAINFLAMFPVSAGVSLAVAPLSAGFNPFYATVMTSALRTAIIVYGLGYTVMPGVTEFFRDWLFPPVTECHAG